MYIFIFHFLIIFILTFTYGEKGELDGADYLVKSVEEIAEIIYKRKL